MDITIPVSSKPVKATIGDNPKEALVVMFEAPAKMTAERLLEAYTHLPGDPDPGGGREALNAAIGARFAGNREFLAILALDDEHAEACRSGALAATALGPLVNDLINIYSGRPTSGSPES